MASSPPPQSVGLPGSNMTSTTNGTSPAVADLASGSGSSSYQVPQFPIERIECKMAAISSRLELKFNLKAYLYNCNCVYHEQFLVTRC